MLRSMDYPSDVDMSWFDGGINAAILDRGVVGFGPFPMKRDLVDDLVPASFSPTSFSGFGISSSFEVPPYDPSYDRVHFHVVVSTLPEIDYDGRNTPGIVSERFSEDGACFFLELDGVYAYPGAGADITSESGQIGATVRFAEFNLSSGLSPLYVYWRPRYYSSGVLSAEGEFNGLPVVHYSSPVFNTGSPSGVWPQTTRICAGSSWSLPSFPEVYIGLSPSPGYYTAGGNFLVHADASVDPSGFRFMNGDSLDIVPFAGIPVVHSGSDIHYFTPAIRIKSPLYVCSRMKWAGGEGPWKSSILIPSCSHDDPGGAYTPSLVMHVQAGSSTDYHLQVIYGTSPLLTDYFNSPSDVDPDPSSPHLFHASYSYYPLQSGEFSYCVSGEMVNPPISGIPNTDDLYVSHVCPSQYAGVGRLYKFWRIMTNGPWMP